MASSNLKVDYELCDINNLKENEMKDFSIKVNEKEYKILLAKYQNEFYAVGNKCSHYSLPLSNGIIYKGRIRCFAHGACFNIKNGDIEDFPGLDCLPSYKVVVNKTTNKVHLNTTQEELEQKFRIKKSVENVASGTSRPSSSLDSKRGLSTMFRPSSGLPSKQATDNVKKIVIIGSGPAAVECVETLREEGFTNGVTMITREAHAPYDRPKLSKALDIGIDTILLRNENFYKENNINFLKNKTVKKIHFDKQFVECDSGDILNYNKLVIATGLEASNHKQVPGDDLKGIFTLRLYDDSKRIVQYLNEVKTAKGGDVKVLIIGTSFVALESATYFSGKSNVTVICRRLPFSSHFGKQPAEKVVKLHESKGIKFLINSNLNVNEFVASTSDNKRLGSAKMSDGTTLEADICLVAIGSRPATSFLKDSPIKLTSNGYIAVDKYMKTSVDNVYAAGDVVCFPLSCIKLADDTNKDELINVPHWQMSHMHGRIAAYSLIDRNIELNSIPFFWSLNHGKTIRFAGYNDKYDEIIFHEDPEKKNENKFVAFYIVKNRVIGVCSCDWDPICAAVAELMYNNIVITKDNIMSDPWGIKALMS